MLKTALFDTPPNSTENLHVFFGKINQWLLLLYTVFIRIEAPPVLEGNKLNILSNLTFIDS